jgi:uncharacterized membrane protein
MRLREALAIRFSPSTLPMLHRSAACALLCASAMLAVGCRDTPTDPSRPEKYDVTFLGVPAGAESFTPRAVSAGRVVGTARGGGEVWAVQWSNGVFTRIGPTVPAGCESEPVAARGAFTVGQVTCTGAGDTPVDAYGWTENVGALPRLFAEPYGFVEINRTAAIAGNLSPAAQFPQGTQRGFAVQGSSTTLLLPPGARSSQAVGITDAGEVVVTAFYDCAADERGCVPSQALLYAGGSWVEVPIPSDADGTVAAAVSSAGHVAGYTIGEVDGVFVYDYDGKDLDALPVVPGTRVQITGANASGQVVGTGIRQSPAPGQQASYGIIWGDEKQYTLSERIRGDVPWQVTAALGTDDEENIVGTGFNPESGEEGAILLTPPLQN